ncbi:MAG TPA: hypothetical protein VD866_16740 [Urbifossiella sp.]|nr:hypothetical protein [Urbifossiella sp.]
MSRAGNKTWSLDPAEVYQFGTGCRSSTRQRASLPRALDVSGGGLRLVHHPSGVEVSGEIPAGNYSKARLKELRAELHTRLFAELEQRVARHLRVPGR